MKNEDFNGKDLNEGAEKINSDDLKEVLRKKGKILAKLKGPLEKFMEDIRLLFMLLDDYISGRYPFIPWRSVAMIAFTLLYVLWPIDAVPDIIPALGLLDDAACVGLCLACISADLKAYKKWKKAQNHMEEE